MDIHRLILRKISLPLRSPFVTHQGKLHERSVIIIEVSDHQGLKGYGEVSAFSTPFYTAETIETAWHVLRDIILPHLDVQHIQEPGDFVRITSFIQGNQMAKAGLEGALWDLCAKQSNVSLAKLIGGTRASVKAGAVLSLSDSITEDINRMRQSGYERYKLKVEKGKERDKIKQIQSVEPNLGIMIDANGMYREEDLDYLIALDDLGLLMIEQPFEPGDFYLHKLAQEQMNTPICLDESITSLHDAKQAIELGSCQVINIKVCRVGGLTAALNIHDHCQSNGLPVWCGGMVETGIAKAHNLALASLPNFTIPGDLSSSDRYFYRDVLKEPIEVKDGQISVPAENGIGVSVDESYLDQITVQSYTWEWE
ncbi:o-succinylbenzoate synthase [Halobacillus naozhouensis]|uniref:o-succinylbenzoate synthase n=1 Tax=Halobacillus naozhouensis TaxID=554880 RepID=A0ABY8IW29_9BACI|nr:o-succinylbenzoate synthase [Halobacillus naozhouensis]WFT73557.1 o-succinylbenzoate synthase [Halobacillus naozhouensis]